MSRESRAFWMVGSLVLLPSTVAREEDDNDDDGAEDASECC